jgi:hypothetical protein
MDMESAKVRLSTMPGWEWEIPAHREQELIKLLNEMGENKPTELVERHAGAIWEKMRKLGDPEPMMAESGSLHLDREDVDDLRAMHGPRGADVALEAAERMMVDQLPKALALKPEDVLQDS